VKISYQQFRLYGQTLIKLTCRSFRTCCWWGHQQGGSLPAEKTDKTIHKYPPTHFCCQNVTYVSFLETIVLDIRHINVVILQKQIEPEFMQIKITLMEVFAIIMLFVTIGFLIGSNFLIFQKGKIPSVKLTSIDGTEFYSHQVINSNEPVIVVFWKPSITDFKWQFNQMLEAREEILDNHHARIIAICDAPLNKNNELRREINNYMIDTKPEIEIYIDPKGKMRKKLDIPQVPYTMVFNQGSNEIQYFGYRIYNGEETFKMRKPDFAID